MRLVLLAAALVSGAAEASTVAEWRGAGPNACHGACSLDWALEQLPADRRAQVEAAMEEGGAYPILVHRGDVFEFMTYQRGGEPYVDARRTLAAMDEPARSWGWRIGDWSFVQLEECGNWAPVLHEERMALPDPRRAPILPEESVEVASGDWPTLGPPWSPTLVGGSVLPPRDAPLQSRIVGETPLDQVREVDDAPTSELIAGLAPPSDELPPRTTDPERPPPVTAVPLPGGLLPLLAAVAGAWMFARRRLGARAA